MKKAIGIILCGVASVLLVGCDAMNSDMTQLNNSLSALSGQGASAHLTTSKPIANAWHVSNSQAMQWLAQNNATFADHGDVRSVDWYKFWSQQIHYKTPLAQQAYQYCHVNAWDNRTVGMNCQTYWQAYSMTKSEESRVWGQKMEGSV